VLAVVFPGQGSQAVGMAVDFAERYPEARAVFEQADEAFAGPLSTWIAQGPEETLRRTEVTQPAILTASIAIYRVLEPRLVRPPDLFAGHSLGEYSALVAAGGLDLADAIRLVRRRGQLMAEAVPEGEGSMVAVLGLPGDQVARVCSEVDGVVAPANFNSQVQTVIAGAAAAVEAACERLKAAGAKRLVPLAVSAPFHCPLMAPAMEKLTGDLAEARFRDLRVPVVSNVNARPYQSAADARRLLREQVCAPVRWVDCVRQLVRAGARVQLEAGPGNVLSGLAARIQRNLPRANVSSTDEIEPALAAVAEALAQEPA
jgi:[acyl-carrier-protein] S-malonyltransferase